ncbi:Piso0_001984 [Millerozyma farinosa CBS 7064]|uniref:Piso0_001984 protein n=1 Tax=Pichia sorbitophila (strain ATCC MYA-4447 / BCRC 22081 / CBS 7064 / NBRC 10061 / NRRL Y-12695) TaxID=559304 RepID=G8YM81_PICSO|nr:Piso0_001984 [Millerozyma farinosa CBS 7064]
MGKHKKVKDSSKEVSSKTSRSRSSQKQSDSSSSADSSSESSENDISSDESDEIENEKTNSESSLNGEDSEEKDGSDDKKVRKNDDLSAKQRADKNGNDEIVIDLDGEIALSKKQRRLLKKNKLDIEKLKSQQEGAKPPATEENTDGSENTKNKKQKSDFGVWIGNLSYETTKEDLQNFLVTNSKKDQTEDDFEGSSAAIKGDDILRINLPKKANKNKGYAYVDLRTEEQMNTAISLSESLLHGRNLLIKSSSSFEGRPEVSSHPGNSKNPPSRVLFVGNLSFDTTEELLRTHFKTFGDIVRIRMATFEDSGKCKGFAFIDYRDETGPTEALKSKFAKKLVKRTLRLEYGEDRSKRNPRARSMAKERVREPRESREPRQSFDRPAENQQTSRSFSQNAPPPRKRQNHEAYASNKRVKSSVALANAQRQASSIVPSTGKKTVFE